MIVFGRGKNGAHQLTTAMELRRKVKGYVKMLSSVASIAGSCRVRSFSWLLAPPPGSAIGGSDTECNPISGAHRPVPLFNDNVRKREPTGTMGSRPEWSVRNDFRSLTLSPVACVSGSLWPRAICAKCALAQRHLNRRALHLLVLTQPVGSSSGGPTAPRGLASARARSNARSRSLFEVHSSGSDTSREDK